MTNEELHLETNPNSQKPNPDFREKIQILHINPEVWKHNNLGWASQFLQRIAQNNYA